MLDASGTSQAALIPLLFSVNSSASTLQRPHLLLSQKHVTPVPAVHHHTTYSSGVLAGRRFTWRELRRPPLGRASRGRRPMRRDGGVAAALRRPPGGVATRADGRDLRLCCMMGRALRDAPTAQLSG